MKIDLVFLLVIFIFAIYYLGSTKNVEKMSNVSNDIKEGIRQVYLADVDAIRNLSEVAKKLQTGGITNPGNMSINGSLKVNANVNTDGEITIGPNSKFKFNPGGDNWVRLFNSGNDHGDMGFASRRVWTQHLHGKPTIPDGIAGNVTIDGTTRINGEIHTPNGNTIRCDGRQHIMGNELLYILNKSGVIIGKEWGGNGNLNVQGDMVVQGRNIIGELNDINNKINDIYKRGFFEGQKGQFRSYDTNRWLSEINGGAEVRGHRGVWSQFNIFHA